MRPSMHSIRKVYRMAVRTPARQDRVARSRTLMALIYSIRTETRFALIASRSPEFTKIIIELTGHGRASRQIEWRPEHASYQGMQMGYLRRGTAHDFVCAFTRMK